MGWNIDFEICAIVILGIVIALHISRQYVMVRRSHLFLAMLAVEIVTIILDIIIRGRFMELGLDIGMTGAVWIDIYFAVQYILPFLFMYYMVVWCGKSIMHNHKWVAFVLFWLPILCYAGMVIYNFMYQNLYQLDDRLGYIETEGVMVLNFISLYAVMYGLVYAVRYSRALSFERLSLIGVFGSIAGFGCVIQYYMRETIFIDFLVAVSLLVLYLVAQNPADMLDGNTKVMSRSMMDEILRRDIESKMAFDLIVLALDDFKFVNKTFGVTTGDIMLLQVAHFLQTISKRGRVYRYGADQFVVQIRHSDTDVKELLDFVSERFRHPWITEEVSVMLSTTVCCVTFPDDGGSMETLVDVIDYSVLSAKTQGKGNVVFAKDMDLHALRREKAIEMAIEMAMDRDTIEVHYQPIYNTEKDCYTSAEALVRLHDERLGNISPEDFIPIAEKNGMILRLGTMIFEKVCRFISEQNLKETTIEYIEVNVSVVQCMQQNFVEELIEIMEEYHIEPGQINLEVTETAAVNSLAVLQENIEKLHARGISFSLDDYGSGYSTLGYLHRLPFQIIKLDKLMVWDAFENERAGITLKFTVGMLKELKVRIVAEGVETQEQQKHLTGIGCDYLQGWYYSKAVPEDEFAQLIRQEAC